MKGFLEKGQSLLVRRQGSILSAAFVILTLVALSRVLGLIRQRVFMHFFTPQEVAVYLAALRIPETLFELLISGSLASAFIPVFAQLLSGEDKKKAWYVAGVTQTTLLVTFALFSVLIFIFAAPISRFLAPGFSAENQALMTSLTRFLLIVQGFFIVSFFLGSIQESFQRFLVPAFAPLFYNLGIITGAVFLHGQGVWGIAIGAVLGAAVHLLVQLPFAFQIGFRFIPRLDIKNPDFRKIVKLASPRIVEVAVLQVAKSVELFLATTISVASYTYLTFANTLHLLPVALFGYSLGKATLPTLSQYAAKGEREDFGNTLRFSLGQVLFFVIPAAATLTVLRIPIVRLVFGAQRFDWEATVQTSFALSAFAVAIVAQGAIAILARSFYALQDAKTPMFIAISSILLNITLSFLFVPILHLNVWGLALSYSVASVFQSVLLLGLLNKRTRFINLEFTTGVFKIFLAASISGLVMFFLIKVLDQAVWDKRLSFLTNFGLALPATFQIFVLDTRFTINLIFLTLLVLTVGWFVYLVVAALLRCREVELLARWFGKATERQVSIAPPDGKAEIPVPLPPGG